MSNDLISREETEKLLRAYADDVGCNRGEIELANGILKAVHYLDNVPTAYDADMVVERLENERYVAPSDCEYDEEFSEYAEGFNEMVDSAIEIVKSGGLSATDGKEG